MIYVDTSVLVALVTQDDHQHGLRGADALHLAVAQALDLQRFATLDRNQSRNAQRLGFTLELPLIHGL